MSTIAGMKPEESKLLIGHLRREMDDPNIQVRWRWSPGDVAIWDERCTAHRGLSDHFAVDPHRLVHSVFVFDRATAA
jgi:taurine dioxygenase